MAKNPKPKHQIVDDELLDLLCDTASHTSRFAADILYDSNGHGRYGGPDGRETLLEIMQILISLCGSGEAAVDWLFRAERFNEVAGSLPCVVLENGDFWSLAAMLDWLKIIDHYKSECGPLIEGIFRDWPYGVPSSPLIIHRSDHVRPSSDLPGILKPGNSKTPNEDVPGG